MKKYLMIFPALAILATACQEKEVTPELSLTTPSEVTVQTEGEIISVGFTTNVDWTASIDNSNWSVTPTSGAAGNVNIKVTALPNESDDPAIATLTISAKSLSQKVTFTQLQKDCLSLEKESIEITDLEQNIEVKVLANVSYTVESDVEWLKYVETKGAVSSTAIVAASANTGEAREGHLTFSGAGKKVEFTVKQAAFAPFFNVKGTDEDGYVYAPVSGGTLYVQVQTNLEYTYKTYEDSSFPWQHVTVSDDGIYTIVIDANDGFDARTSYIKFTIPYIQDPVLDDNGEPTGETADHVERVYIAQDGNIQNTWSQDFTWDLYNESHRYSMATAGDYLIVSTGIGVQVFSKKDGSFVMNLTSSLPFIPTGITNDDAGNIVFSTGGNYPLSEEEEYVPLQVWALPAADIMNISAAKKVITYTNGWYGYGLDNIRVSGDIFKDAVVTMISAAGWAAGSSIVCWEIKDGAAAVNEYGENSYTDYVGLPWTSEIWASYNMVAKHIGDNLNSGVLTIGYDGNYNLHYNPSMSGANWQEVFVTGSSWAEGYNALDIIDWNGHKYAAFIGMSYFGKVDWGGTGEYSYMPSYLFLMNIDNPSAPELISKLEYTMTPGDMFVYGATTDICLEVEDGGLAAYVFDSGVSKYMKVVYPNL